MQWFHEKPFSFFPVLLLFEPIGGTTNNFDKESRSRVRNISRITGTHPAESGIYTGSSGGKSVVT